MVIIVTLVLKYANLTSLLKNKIISEAIDRMKVRDCMSPRFLPMFFIKLGMRPLARLMFRLRSWNNYRKELK